MCGEGLDFYEWLKWDLLKDMMFKDYRMSNLTKRDCWWCNQI